MSVNEKMTALADAIREKSGVTGKLTIDGMTSAVKAISSLIVASASGNPIVLNDSTDLRVQSLRLFGKTTQNGTPSPNAPVPLVSAGDGGDIRTLILPAVKSLEDDMLHGIPVTSGGNYTDETGQQWVCDEVDFSRGVYVQKVKKKRLSSGLGWAYSSGTKRFYVQDSEFKSSPTMSYDMHGNMCTHFKVSQNHQLEDLEMSYINQTSFGFGYRYDALNGNVDAWKTFLNENEVYIVAELATPIETPLSAEELAAYAEKYGVTGTVYGRTTQNGTPSPDTPVPLVSYADVCQSILASTPNGLPGIPVTSGGNYTDETGQQWVCDEVDFGRGIYVQRIFGTVFKSAVGWNIAGTKNGLKRFYTNQFMGVIKNAKDDATKECAICSHFINVTASDTWNEVTGISVNSKGRLDIYYSGIEQTTAALDVYFSSNPVAFMAELATPIETSLSAEELAAYAALHTNYPNTTILNDGGAGMEVKYVADTKNYIDNQIAAVAAAIVNA